MGYMCLFIKYKFCTLGKEKIAFGLYLQKKYMFRRMNEKLIENAFCGKLEP